MTSKKQPFKIGKCDCCESEDVYIEAGFDSWGTHVVDCCFYGCDDPRNIPNEVTEDISILQVEKIDHVECYESKWSVSLSVDGKPLAVRLTRHNTETEERLRSVIASCHNSEDIVRLNCTIFHN